MCRNGIKNDKIYLNYCINVIVLEFVTGFRFKNVLNSAKKAKIEREPGISMVVKVTKKQKETEDEKLNKKFRSVNTYHSLFRGHLENVIKRRDASLCPVNDDVNLSPMIRFKLNNESKGKTF